MFPGTTLKVEGFLSYELNHSRELALKEMKGIAWFASWVEERDARRILRSPAQHVHATLGRAPAVVNAGVRAVLERIVALRKKHGDLKQLPKWCKGAVALADVVREYHKGRAKKKRKRPVEATTTPSDSGDSEDNAPLTSLKRGRGNKYAKSKKTTNKAVTEAILNSEISAAREEYQRVEHARLRSAEAERYTRQAELHTGAAAAEAGLREMVEGGGGFGMTDRAAVAAEASKAAENHHTAADVAARRAKETADAPMPAMTPAPAPVVSPSVAAEQRAVLDRISGSSSDSDLDTPGTAEPPTSKKRRRRQVSDSNEGREIKRRRTAPEDTDETGLDAPPTRGTSDPMDVDTGPDLKALWHGMTSDQRLQAYIKINRQLQRPGNTYGVAHGPGKKAVKKDMNRRLAKLAHHIPHDKSALVLDSPVSDMDTWRQLSQVLSDRVIIVERNAETAKAMRTMQPDATIQDGDFAEHFHRLVRDGTIMMAYADFCGQFKQVRTLLTGVVLPSGFVLALTWQVRNGEGMDAIQQGAELQQLLNNATGDDGHKTLYRYTYGEMTTRIVRVL